ncbi:DNA polymerase III delta prime subunit [hydrothermal vent metagenome]|uniref:DNA polymerase III delta prime subunit n=1 Tax=hydrothermal vent metagenome TaxID=652676 RepID=A0A3B0VHE5_9ZZZZ
MRAYPWLQDNISHWQQLVLKQQVPHAILLSGAKGLGKLELANQMAHIALCEQLLESGVCNVCTGCNLVKAGSHTDLITIAAEKAIIKVEQIRQLSKDIILSSSRNQHRVVIIEDAEKMNKASANALLKTLEEPPAKVVIILTTSEIAYLLPTIKSRCNKINISAPRPNVARDWLSSIATKSSAEIQLSLLLANGAPIVAKNILLNDTLESVTSMLDDLNQLRNKQKSVLDISKHWHVNELLGNLRYIAAYFLTLLKINNGLNPEYSPKSVDFDNSYLQVQNFDTKTLKFLHNIYKCIARAETALKTELLIEELLINWQHDFKIP